MKVKIDKVIKEIYQDYDEKVMLFMANVHLFIKSKYGKIDGSWLNTLEMLADYVETYWACKEYIRKEGLIVTNRFDQDIVNPLLKVKNDAATKIQLILDSFGLTPKANAKINSSDAEETDLLENLLG